MLMLVTRPDERLPFVVRAAVEGGVNVVQIRGGDVDSVCAAAGHARVVVNSSVVLSREDGEGSPSARSFASLRMTGIHLPETAPFERASFVGRSVHSVDAALRAEAEGCEYVVAGSVFPTASHPNGPTGGLQLVRDIAAAVKIPVIAIGGINAANARSCIDAGARGVAVISAIFDAEDPKRAAEELRRAIA